jgi:beta-glucanase (GH16 family)
MKSFKHFFCILTILSFTFTFITCFTVSGNKLEDIVLSSENLIFSDEFDGTSLDTSKWNNCPEWNRHRRSTWKDDMISVSDGYLHLKFKRDPQLGASISSNPAIANNWIRAGAVRTRKKDSSSMLFENSYGYYEARIKFPVVSGTWGAFWLMSPTMEKIGNGGRDGAEIDIIETVFNENGVYNSALHCDGYGKHIKSFKNEVNVNSKSKPVNIYDGEFHVFSLNWTPSEYVFYVDGLLFWRVNGGIKFKNTGINKTPNYIKLTVESADWAGDIPQDFVESEMLVDYVRVYKR